MNEATLLRLFGYREAFAHPVSVWISVAVAVCLVGAWIAIRVLNSAGKLGTSQYAELNNRTRSWCILAPLLIGPVLLGAAWVMVGVTVLSIWCYREYARATGLFRHSLLSLVVVIGILALSFSIADHWYGLFSALPALGIILIASVGILADAPRGYIQRVALAVFGFLLFGVCLGHLGYMANDGDFRPILLMILLTVELNDVFAYLCGKSFGRRKLAPNTSPNKTIGGALGALVCTTALVWFLGHSVFRGTEMDHPGWLIGLGLIISLAGQLGDLMLSSIKRDIGIKDMAATIPGHGGLLDRFDSLLLVAPAVFHYVGYVRGFGLDQVPRIITGG